MGFQTIRRYFLTMWPILSHIHWLLSRSRIHRSILAAGHAPKEVAPNCCNLCRRGTGVRASQAAQVPKRSAGEVWDWCRFFYTHKKRPQSGEERTLSITSIIPFPTRLLFCWTRGDKIADCQILHWELHSHWFFLLCAVSSISLSSPLVNGGGDVSLQGQIERIQPLYYSGVLMYQYNSIYSGWVPVLNFQLWHFLSGKQDRSCRPSMSCFVFMFDKSSLGLARCSLNQGQTRWRFGGVEEQDDGSEGEEDDANWMQTTSLEFTCRPAPIAQQTIIPTNIPHQFLDTKKAYLVQTEVYCILVERAMVW